LSGLQDDGSEGLIAIKLCGGLCLVQQPSDALWPEMPRNAMARDHVDHCLPVAEMAGLIARLVREPPGPERPVPQNLMVEAQIAAQETPVSPEHTTLGSPSPLSCPQCGGVLNEVNAEGSTRFRCQIGHGFTADGLLAAQNDELERALESAIRIHRDRVALFRRLQQKTLPAMPLAAARWKTSAEESEHAARLIEGALKKMRHGPEEPSAKPAPVQDSHIPVQDSRIEGC
jgi:two-component system chemotaxis response regulator CheB